MAELLMDKAFHNKLWEINELKERRVWCCLSLDDEDNMEGLNEPKCNLT
jgi:hypothetical protein